MKSLLNRIASLNTSARKRSRCHSKPRLEHLETRWLFAGPDLGSDLSERVDHETREIVSRDNQALEAVISADRRYLTLENQPTIGTLQRDIDVDDIPVSGGDLNLADIERTLEFDNVSPLDAVLTQVQDFVHDQVEVDPTADAGSNSASDSAGENTLLGCAILSDIEAFFLIQASQGDHGNVMEAPNVAPFNGEAAWVSDPMGWVMYIGPFYPYPGATLADDVHVAHEATKSP